MKKLTMISMAALLLLAVSCKKDKEQQIDGSGIGFRATVESHEGDSKTHLDGVAVNWDSNDEILVQSNTCAAGKRFVLVYEEGDEAGFNPAETLPEGFYSPNYTAYYPADMMQTGTFTLPAIQTYKANSFGNGANPMIAVCNDNKKLAFKNICGLLKLQLYSETACRVRSITLISHKENELLCGTGTVDWNGDEPKLSLASGDGSLTLDCGAEGLVMSTKASNPSVFYFVVPAGALSEGFTVKVTDTGGKYWIKAAKASTDASTDNTIARSKIKPMPKQEVACTHPEGTLPGLFSVGSGRQAQVRFSQGNLQYKASTNTWRFAENQWNFVGTQKPGAGFVAGGNVYENGIICDNADRSPSYDGWIDLFGWGTSGYDHGATVYQPWSNDQDNTHYYAYGDFHKSLYEGTGEADWGENTISNGHGSDWYTPTHDEFTYLLNTRTDAKKLFGLGKVCGVPGLIILPDGWDWSKIQLSDLKPDWKPRNSFGDGDEDVWDFSINNYLYSDWAKMEAMGALFLPAAGNKGNNVTNVTTNGYYWDSDWSEEYSCCISFYAGKAKDSGPSRNYRSRGFSVRLVANYP